MNGNLLELIEATPALEACAADIERAFIVLRDCFREGGKLLLCGNGGSAADCEHWSGELLKGFLKKRPLSPEWKEKLGEPLASGLQGALPAVPLTGFLSFSTAFANDVSPELVFAQGVWALGRPGDVLAGISTSGNSRNVCLAVRAAAALGMRTVALTGADGGKLAGLAEVCIRVPAQEVHLVQQYHLPVYHCLCRMLEDEFFSA
jgi:D-sedoheptulose 7-phosphate isomerase